MVRPHVNIYPTVLILVANNQRSNPTYPWTCWQRRLCSPKEHHSLLIPISTKRMEQNSRWTLRTGKGKSFQKLYWLLWIEGGLKWKCQDYLVYVATYSWRVRSLPFIYEVCICFRRQVRLTVVNRVYRSTTSNFEQGRCSFENAKKGPPKSFRVNTPPMDWCLSTCSQGQASQSLLGRYTYHCMASTYFIRLAFNILY